MFNTCRNTSRQIMSFRNGMSFALCGTILTLMVSCGPATEPRTDTKAEATKVRCCPVLIDWTCFNDHGISYGPPPLDTTPVARVDGKGEIIGTLEDLREQLRPKPTFARVEMIRGYPCAIANSGHAPSNLDVLVSIDVENVSTWEAIKVVVVQVQCGLLYGTKMHFTVCRPYPGRTPPEFYRVRNISLHLDDVTAREALCAILRQSVLQIGIRYHALRDPKLDVPEGMSLFDIWFYENGKRMQFSLQKVWPPAPPDEPNFTVECQEAQQPAEDCGDRKAPEAAKNENATPQPASP